MAAAGGQQQQQPPLHPPPLLQIPPRQPPPVVPANQPLVPQQQQAVPNPPQPIVRPPVPVPPPPLDTDGNMGSLMDPNWFRVVIMKCTASVHEGTASVTLDRWQGIWTQLPNEFVESALHASSGLPIRHLILKQHNLTELPKNFAAVKTWLPTSLVTLDLSHNRFSSLPPVICQLTGLQDLNLSHNFISSLPEQISNLTKLTALSLQANRLPVLPAGVCTLTSLRTLNAEDNMIETVPSEICQLQHLKALYLKCNRITSLPQRLMELPHLEELHLSNNRLEYIELAGLQSLRQLHLANNRIQRLPYSLAQINLQGLTLSNNPLVFPPMFVCRKGLRAIRHYVEHYNVVIDNNPMYENSDSEDTGYEGTP